jgi:hypothetical protein
MLLIKRLKTGAEPRLRLLCKWLRVAAKFKSSKYDARMRVWRLASCVLRLAAPCGWLFIYFQSRELCNPENFIRTVAHTTPSLALRNRKHLLICGTGSMGPKKPTYLWYILLSSDFRFRRVCIRLRLCVHTQQMVDGQPST